MYIIKNAWINIKRHLGRNILIGLIVLVVALSSTIALSINTSGNKLIESYKDKNELAVSFRLDMSKLRDESNTYTKLTVSDIENYADSDYVSSYYYTLDTSLSSDDIEAIDMSEKFEPKDNGNAPNSEIPRGDIGGNGDDMTSQGDYKITAYSDPSYIENFINGTSKITSGSMITKDDEENHFVISEELATQNDLEVGDEITFYLPSDSSITYTFEITGIFETIDDSASDDFMNMNALNAQNQIYTTVTAINNILEDDDSSNSLNATIYLKNQDDLEAYAEEVKDKCLSDYYTLSDNTDEITSTLTPIKNISNFSMTFLIIILIVGAIILAVINILNIRDRKYEIGVLRAIGMSKTKLILSLLTELFIVTAIAFIIGIIGGKLLSQPVTNKMLENEINSQQVQTENTRENFGGRGFERPNERRTTQNYEDSLTVTLDAKTIIILFSFGLILVIVSGSASAIFITKYNPNQILRNQT